MTDFQIYLNAIGREPLLTPAEEVELARLIKAAQALQGLPEEALTAQQKRQIKIGARARQRMVAANIRLAVNVAKKYKSRAKHLAIEDLTQEAVFGLVRAAEMFNPELGYKFSTYSYGWIRQSVMRAISNLDLAIRVPIHVKDQAFRYKREQERSFVRTGTMLSPQEAARRAEASLEMLEMGARAKSIMALNSILDTETELIDLVSSQDPEAGLLGELGIEPERIHEAVSRLPALSAEVLRRNFGLKNGQPEALTSIASSLGLSRDRTIKAQRQGKALLRQSLGLQGMRP